MENKNLSATSKKRLSRLLLYIGDAEKEIENKRHNLCQSTLFEPYAAFKRIDRYENSYIIGLDILTFLE